MSNRKIISQKDGNGQYVPIRIVSSDISIDNLLKSGLTTIQQIMTRLELESKIGIPERESIQSLKDCMAMLHELKKHEKELLDDLDEADLTELTGAN